MSRGNGSLFDRTMVKLGKGLRGWRQSMHDKNKTPPKKIKESEGEFSDD